MILEKIYYLIVSLRPRQWLKNLAVFAAIFFGGRFLNHTDFLLVSLTFIIFCLLSSGMYLINDIVDLEADKIHFSKKMRPLPAGKIAKKEAFLTALVLIALGLVLALKLSLVLLITCLIFVF